MDDNLEDLSKNIEKELTRLSVSKKPKKRKQWIVLFSDDRGTISSFNRLKELSGLIGLFIVLILCGTVVLSVFYNKTVRENQRLTNRLEASQKSVTALRREKELLSVRLVALESRLKMLSAENQEAKTEAEKVPPAGEPPAPEPEDPEPVAEMAAEESMETADSSLQEPEGPDEADADVSVPMVAVEAFEARDPGDAAPLKVQFKIKNVQGGGKPVAGYTFVVLKSKSDSPDQWTILPEVDLVDGSPAQFKKGTPFSIYRFKTLRFVAKRQPENQGFESATVLVYNVAGKLMLHEDFRL